MKVKMMIILSIIVLLLFTSGITYSIFKSDVNATANQKIAKFVFDAQELDSLELSLSNIYPGDVKEYNFSVTNSNESKVSNVTLNYQIIIKTYHFMPITIELYKGEDTVPIMTCDETYTRNSENELVCNSDTQEMTYNNNYLDDYQIKVTFPSDYNSENYKNLVDFIEVEINSWQKV